jgi:AhpD family alkylhydroperoxidase
MEEPLTARCLCTCHRALLGEFRALFHQGRYVEALKLERDITANWDGVDVASILEAAAACPACLDSHCPALREQKAKREKAVWVDPPLMPPPPEPPISGEGEE